ncbi:MAG: hypothetical protein J07HX64_01339 [halophilic archaeon J07HX64]|nr:MAG: hypothetical protein J07HX64_01339 [halophilic archaeon J07HX64]
MSDDDRIGLACQLSVLFDIARYRPPATLGTIGLSISARLLEGVGLSSLVPVIEMAQGNTGAEEMSGVEELSPGVSELVGVPFALESVIVGVGVLVTVRYTATFLVGWLTAALQSDHVRHLKRFSTVRTPTTSTRWQTVV